jgi:hypothetical protein
MAGSDSGEAEVTHAAPEMRYRLPTLIAVARVTVHNNPFCRFGLGRDGVKNSYRELHSTESSR